MKGDARSLDYSSYNNPYVVPNSGSFQCSVSIPSFLTKHPRPQARNPKQWLPFAFPFPTNIEQTTGDLAYGWKP